MARLFVGLAVSIALHLASGVIADEKPQGATLLAQARDAQQRAILNLAKLVKLAPADSLKKLSAFMQGASDSQKAQFVGFLADASDSELQKLAAKMMDAGQLQGNWWESQQLARPEGAVPLPRAPEQTAREQVAKPEQSTSRHATSAGAPELLLSRGHSDKIKSLALSRDGRWIVSGGDDRTITIWDVSSGRALRSLVDTNRILAVAISPDNRWLASQGDVRFTRIWDFSTGQEIYQLKGAAGGLAFSPDSAMLVSAEDRTVKLWDVSKRRLVQTLSGHKGDVFQVVFSDDGRLLASASSDSTVKLWELPGGRERFTFTMSDRPRMVAFSADNRLVAALSSDGNFLAHVGVWDTQTGRQVRSMWQKLPTSPGALTFASDGNQLISIAGESVASWSITTGNVQTQAIHRGRGSLAAFSSDRRRLAQVRETTYSGQIEIFDVSAWNQVQTLEGAVSPTRAVQFSAEGSSLSYETRWPHGVALWDRASGRHRLWTMPSSGVGYVPAEFGGPSYTVNDRGVTRIVDLNSGRTQSSVSEHVDGTVGMSRDGRLLAYNRIRPNNEMIIWDTVSSRVLQTLRGHKYPATNAVFSPDGRLLVSAEYNENTVVLWQVGSGLPAMQAKLNLGPSTPLQFSPDGRLLVVGTTRGLQVFEAGTGRQVALLTDAPHVPSSAELSYSYSHLAFSPDGRWIASGHRERVVKLWQVGTWREMRTLQGHSDEVTGVGFSSDSQVLASTSRDGSVRLWETNSGEHLATLISLGRTDTWAVIAPDGLFDAPPDAWHSLMWRFAGETANISPLEVFFNEFYHPGLLTELLNGKRPKAPRNIAQLDRRQPGLKLSLSGTKASAPRTVSTRSIAVEIEVTEASATAERATRSGARDVRLFRNGALVKAWRGDVVSGKGGRATLNAIVPIVAGENRLTAYAFNRDNIKSADANITIVGAENLKRPGTAYILVVGVNEYANRDYNLKWAVADAKALGDEMLRQQTKLGVFGRVEVIPLLDHDATKANILRALERLAGASNVPAGAPPALQKLQPAQPEDAVIIYFAGHGIAVGPRFHLVPHDLGYAGLRTKMDEGGLKTLLSHSVSDLDLEKALEKVDAGRLTLIIDACESGQALEAEEKRRGPMNSKGLAQLAYEKGMYVLTAAQGYQAALEAEKLGHGFFTYALVEEGLKTAAADTAPTDGQISLREWFDFAVLRVPELQMAMQEEMRKQGREIFFVDGDRSVSAPRDRSLQHPRAFYRPESEARPFIVAKPDTRPSR